MAFDDSFRRCERCGFEWGPLDWRSYRQMAYWRDGLARMVPEGCLLTGEGDEE